MYKRTLLVIMIVVILLSCFSSITIAKVYNDTSGHWAQTYIDEMTELGIMESSSSTLFYPEQYFSRKEAAKSGCMLFKERNLASSPHPFTDVSTTNEYSKYIKWMYDNGVISGTSSTTFSPDAYIKRQDLCVILYNLYFTRIGVPYYSIFDKVTYSDDSTMSSYAKSKVYALQSIGVVTDNGGAFRPKEYATKAETATMFYMLWQYSTILSVPQEEQSESSWCWAACAKMLAEYRHQNSRTQKEIANYVNLKKGRDENANLSASYEDVADGADYGSYNTIVHIPTGILSSETLIEHLSQRKPLGILITQLGSDNQWHGHFIVCIGYVRRYLGDSQNKFFFFDVYDSTYHWLTYDELLTGTGYFSEKEYVYSIYSL